MRQVHATFDILSIYQIFNQRNVLFLVMHPPGYKSIFKTIAELFHKTKIHTLNECQEIRELSLDAVKENIWLFQELLSNQLTP